MAGPGEGTARLATIAGIRIELAPSWFVIFALLLWSLAVGVFPTWQPGLPAGLAWLGALVTAAAFFACLVLHELAHALVARRFGQDVRRIVLFLFGGVSVATSEMRSPREELAIALAGPATSVALGAALLVGAAGLADAGAPPWVAAAAQWLGQVNLVLAAFNLVPGFPLDGGRVLRAAVWAWTGDLRRATRWASLGGQAFALLLVGLGAAQLLAGSWLQGAWLILLGWLLFGAARAAHEALELKAALHGWRVADMMSPSVVAVPPTLSLQEAVDGFLARYDYATFPVVHDGRLVGVLEDAAVAAVPPERWASTGVDAAMRPLADVATLAPGTPGDEAYERLARAEAGRLPVVADGRVVGVLSERDLARRLIWSRRQGASRR